MSYVRFGSVIRLSVLLVLLSGTACSVVGPPIASEMPLPAPAPEPASAPAAPEPAPAPRASGDAAAPRVRLQAVPDRILIATRSDIAEFHAVADALEALLGSRYSVVRLDFASDDAGQRALAALDRRDLESAVAIGMDAAKLVADVGLPVVFCQIFNYERFLANGGTYGISPLPPLDAQLAAWKRLAPGVDAVGMVVGAEHSLLIGEARAAAAEANVALHVQFAESDREALYRFKRIVPDVDGFWLFPDNDILSPGVLREMLDYMVEHEVHGIVFNPSLIEWGALMSMGSRPDDVARAAAAVLDAVVARRSDAIPALTPLAELDVRINEELALDLGLVPAAAR